MKRPRFDLIPEYDLAIPVEDIKQPGIVESYQPTINGHVGTEKPRLVKYFLSAFQFINPFNEYHPITRRDLLNYHIAENLPANDAGYEVIPSEEYKLKVRVRY